MEWDNVLIAGIVATAVMTVAMYIGKSAGMQLDMPRMLGLMFTEPSSSAVAVIGLMAHVMMGVVFAAVYSLAFDAFDIDQSWLWGALFGAVHGAVVGMAMGMMPMMHPRMGDGKELPAPGFFGRNLGGMIPVAIIGLHVLYGGIVGALL
ncbi:MAG: hypothetical protein AB7V46_04885 [Thermomicrobiales bacterium]